MRAHIIGVVVRETTSEINTATESVTANSRNSRPTMLPINSNGRNTAMRDRLIEMTVNPTSREPRIAACTRVAPCFDVPRDVFEHDNGVVDDKAGRNRQRHQR